jgi:Reverse transcriptase (RNA-dependent DNA polymerase)
VATENGTKALYARLNKALYGCVKSALLWYKLFYGTLKKMGFELNPYDPCIANCTIKGSQCTIAWYVDDTKISHKCPEVVTEVIEQLEGHFGKMAVTRGKEHVFLGMNIRYTEERTAVITMKEYLREAISESGLDIKQTATTPAKRDLLFDVDDSSPGLNVRDAETLHSVSAKLLYVAIRACMDLLLAVGFLCTRVSKSNKQDQEKLKRVLEYINGTIDKEYTLGADHLANHTANVG